MKYVFIITGSGNGIIESVATPEIRINAEWSQINWKSAEVCDTFDAAMALSRVYDAAKAMPRPAKVPTISTVDFYLTAGRWYRLRAAALRGEPVDAQALTDAVNAFEAACAALFDESTWVDNASQ